MYTGKRDINPLLPSQNQIPSQEPSPTHLYTQIIQFHSFGEAFDIVKGALTLNQMLKFKSALTQLLSVLPQKVAPPL